MAIRRLMEDRSSSTYIDSISFTTNLGSRRLCRDTHRKRRAGLAQDASRAASSTRQSAGGGTPIDVCEKATRDTSCANRTALLETPLGFCKLCTVIVVVANTQPKELKPRMTFQGLEFPWRNRCVHPSFPGRVLHRVHEARLLVCVAHFAAHKAVCASVF